MSTRLITGDARSSVEPFNWASRRALGLPVVSPLFAAGPPPLKPAPEFAPAIDEAFARGEAAGRAAAAGELRAAAESGQAAFARAVASLGSYRARLRHDAERDLVELALSIARRIVRRELSVDPEAITGLARAALDRIDAREVRSVRLHPAQAQAAAAHLARLAPGIEIIADASLEPGAAVFDTARGAFDAGLDTQIAEIERGLADILE